MATSGEVKVVVFDLNGTFYNESSKDEFYKFICLKRPKRLWFVFQMAFYKVLKKLHQVNKTEFKENFFNYLDDLPPSQVEKYAAEFWEREYPANFNQELKKHFDELREKGIKIFCATGGLELYVKPLFKLFQVDGFAGTRVAYTNNTYKVLGKACKNNEKLKRLDEAFSEKPYRIIEAYSDSKEEILDKAEKAFLIKNGHISPYS
nr:haloacid dehalogenase-like hydrolase [Pontibacter silvestris]